MKLLILIGVATLSNDRGSPWRVLTLVAGILEEILGRMMRLKDLGEIQRNREEQKVSERCVQCVLEKKSSKRSFSKPKGSIFSSCFGRSHKGHSPGTVPNSHSGVQFFEQCRPCQSLFQRQIFRSNPVRTQMFCRHLVCRVYNNNYRGYIPTNMVSFQSHSHIMSYP